ncbi:amino acid adenylation domain-containing protein [Nocardia sp. NPDC127579]|uniref:amino acid adenylation domain-containing protein n=1 Tax=Nocardia sp. NPDC127579 TaxID=3345402 RepID=UPI00362D62EF
MDTARHSGRGARRRSDVPTFGQLLTAAVESAADTVAVRAGAEEFTYHQLDADSARLARELVGRGIGPGDVVAVGIARGIESVLAVWAIAKTGAAFVPVDPSAPAERIAHIVGDSAAVLGLTTSRHRRKLGSDIYWIELDDPVVAQRMLDRPEHPLADAELVRSPHERHPAYVLYTSADQPEGVVVTHSGLAGLVAAQAERYRISGESRVLHVCSLDSDVSVLELLLAFSRGAALIVSPPTVSGGVELAELLRRESVTHMLITPGALESVDPAELPDLRVVVVTGDRFGPELVGRWAIGDREFYSGYGPAEATILVTGTAPIRADEPVTLGSAIPGVGVFVLDARLRPVPSGIVGELYLSGPALAQGYLGRPGPTAERFVASPFDPEAPGTRLYRTGELVRRTESGVIEHVGRVDAHTEAPDETPLNPIDEPARTTQPEPVFAEREYRVRTTPAVQAGEPVGVRPERVAEPVDLLSEQVTELADLRRERVDVQLEHSAEPVSPRLEHAGEHEGTNPGRMAELAETQSEHAAEPVDVRPDRTDELTDSRPKHAAEPEGIRHAPEPMGPQPEQDAEPAGLRLEHAAEPGGAQPGRAAEPVDVRPGQVPEPVDLRPERVGAQLEHVLEPVGKPFGQAAEFEGMRSGQGAEPARRVVRAVVRPDRVPLSFAQQRPWGLNRIDPDSVVDNVPVAVRLTGRLDVAALQSAIRDLVQRHEVLRTVYPAVDGGGTQVVLPLSDPRAVPPLPTLDAAADRVVEFVTRVAMTKFDVTAKPPVRVQLLRLSDTEHVLVCVVHQISGDRFSMGPLIRDLMTAYAERARGARPEWPEPAVQYADYALWQRDTLGSEDDPESPLSEQIAYWRGRLAALPEQLNLPADRPRPAIASKRGATLRTTIDAQLHAALYQVARQHDSTLFMVAHTALAVLLARLSGTRDIVIGTPVAGRGEAALDELVGMFDNTLVLRTEIHPGAAFAELIGQVRHSDIEAFEHADVSFERLVQLLDPMRSTARHPLFQVQLVLRNSEHTRLELPELTVTGTDSNVPLAKFDLQLEIVEEFAEGGAPQGISLVFNYATDLFDEPTVQDLVDRFRRILLALTADAATVAGDVDLLAPGERDLVLREWNSPGAQIPEVSLVDLIAAQALRRPDAVAVRSQGAELTFGELLRRANRVARALIAHGAGPETLVAVALPRTEELPVGLLGVLLTGAGYLPIDTTYPARRLEFMLSDAAPTCVLTTAAVADAVPAGDVPVLRLEATGDLPDTPLTDRDRLAPLRPDNLAYVIYTSGSTGVPKGVGVAHRNVVELFANTQLLFDFDETDVWTLFHSYAFDFSVWELWCALANGGTVVVVDQVTAGSPELLRELLIRERVTVLNQTPSAFHQLAEVDHAASSAGELALRYVVLGGEALDLRQLRRWYERHAVDEPWLVNMYGITETTVHVSFLELNDQMVEGAASLIGRALPGSDAYVADERLHPAPVGVAGEIHIAGKQLARGYPGRPGLTATRFVADPFGAPGARMYRTGDVGRWVGFGGRASLEYAGRGDRQVQLRGFRIELGEIESALLGCPGVSQAVVLVHEGDRLVGYVVPDTAAQLEPTELRSAAAEFLTAEMVPDAIVLLNALPLTPNGKLDRKALPAPEFVSSTVAAPAARSTSAPGPSTPPPLARSTVDSGAPVRPSLAGGAVDGGASVGLSVAGGAVDGGASAGLSVAGGAVDGGASAGLSVAGGAVDGGASARPSVARGAAGTGPTARPPLARGERPGRIPLTLQQQRMWARNQLDQDSAAYNIPLAIRLTGVLDVSALRYAVADVLERHEALRTRYPGPGGLPYQEIVSVADALPGGLDAETTDDPIGRLTTMMSGGFDVTAAVPLRAVLLTSPGNPEEHLLVVVVHHIAADGVSMAPLARDLATAYVARVEGRSPAWVPLELQYADFALWQRAAIGAEDDASSVASAQLAYWRERLSGLRAEPAVPLDRPRPPVPSLRGAATGLALPADVREQLAQLAREHDSTLFMVVHAALAVLLARMSGSADIVIGTPIAGRGERALDDLVGTFGNTLALRTTVEGDVRFTDLVARTRETDLSAFDNADVPFERVVEEVTGGLPGTDPLFQVVLSFQSTEMPSLRLPGLTIAGLDLSAISAEFDLQVIVDARTSGELTLEFSYATDIFDESTVHAFAGYFARILTAVAADPAVIVGDIALLDAEKRDRGDIEQLATAERLSMAEEPVVAERPSVTEEFAVVERPAVAEEFAVAARSVAVEQPVVAEEPVVAERLSVAEEFAVLERPAVAEEFAAAERPAVVEQSVVAERPAVAEPSVAAERAAMAERPVAEQSVVADPVENIGTAGAALTQSLTAAVEDDPQAPAVVWGAAEVSYQDLDARSSRLARLLIEHGCGPGTGVAVRLGRGVDAVVASWAVLKTGAALVGSRLPAGIEVAVGLGSGPEALRWLDLAAPEVRSALAAQSPRPVTYANRLRTLRGGDTALFDDGGALSYDELAAAVDRFVARTGLTFESRTYGTGGPVSAASLLEVVAAGAHGAAVVVTGDAGDLTAVLADEWVTHVVTDQARLDGVDFAALEDLRAAVLVDGSGASAGIEVVALAELLGVKVPSRIG